MRTDKPYSKPNEVASANPLWRAASRDSAFDNCLTIISGQTDRATATTPADAAPLIAMPTQPGFRYDFAVVNGIRELGETVALITRTTNTGGILQGRTIGLTESHATVPLAITSICDFDPGFIED